MNRYNELTKEQQLAFDNAINAQASGTDVTFVVHTKDHQARLRAVDDFTDMTGYELAMGFDN